MLICYTSVSSGPLGPSEERGSNNGKVLCSRLIYGPDFTFYLDYFYFLSNLRTFNV